MTEHVSIQQVRDMLYPGLRSLVGKFNLPAVEARLEGHDDSVPLTLELYHILSDRSLTIKPLFTVGEINNGSYKDKWRPRVEAAFTAFAVLIA
jgi:hypothetical protein